VFTGINSQ